MVGVVEAAGLAIVGGCTAQAVMSLYGTFQRRVRESNVAAREAQLFQQRAQLLLQSDRVDRERSELSWNGNRKFYIDRKVEEAKDICSFYLRPHDHNKHRLIFKWCRNPNLLIKRVSGLSSLRTKNSSGHHLSLGCKNALSAASVPAVCFASS